MHRFVYNFSRCGGIAQMVERLVRIQEVRGSIPLISTMKKREYLFDTFFFYFTIILVEIRGIEGDRAEH